MNKGITRTLIALLLLAAAACPAPAAPANGNGNANGNANVNANANALRPAPRWQAKARAKHQTEWQSVTLITNPVTRRVRSVTNAYVELATGLNYRDPASGGWAASDPAFRITRRGAEATAGGHTVRLAPDICSAGSVTVTKDGVTMQSHPLCIDYYDPVDGRNVRVAEITNAVGWQVSSNEVIYSNCFNGLRASIRIRNSAAGVEQDLILHEQPGFSPADVGFSTLTRLELFTEYVGSTPLPQISASRVLHQDSAPAGHLQMREPAFMDTTLDFGNMKMTLGRAFTVGGPRLAQGARRELESTPVGKRFEIIAGRKILIEAVPLRRVAPVLSKLPRAGQGGTATNAAALRRAAIREPGLGDEIRSLPGPRLALTGSTNLNIQATAAFFRPAHAEQARAELASYNSADSPLALVVDWVLADAEPHHNYTFRGDTTYRISGAVNLTGTTTIEGGAVLKYDERDGAGNEVLAVLEFSGPIVCQTAPYRPAIFTSVYDNSVGQVIATGPSPGRYFRALATGSYGDQLHDLRISYARIAVHGESIRLKHSQISHCDYAFYTETGQASAGNVLIEDVSTVFGGSYFQASATHVTVDNCWHLLADAYNPYASSGHFVNSIISPRRLYLAPDSLNADVPCDFPSSTIVTPFDAPAFQTVGGGGHYLADNAYASSALRDQGTTAIEANLLAEIRQRTTRPPVLLEGELTEPITLRPMVPRDNDPAPDQGYHYDLVDYLVSDLAVNAPLEITGGAVIGVLWPAPAVTPTIVAPNGLAGTDEVAGCGTLIAAGLRSQQAYGASHFGSAGGPIWITELRFRPDYYYSGPFTATVPQIQINLSTTMSAPDGLNSVFAENTGSDDLMVFTGQLDIR